MRRKALWGALLAGLYVAVALWTSGSPSRPLFDVSPPPQYRWVNPPPAFQALNQRPEGSTHTLPLTAIGTDAASITSNDGQAAVVLKEASFARRPGDKSVVLKITPLDPGPLGPPPSGLRYDGNAYSFTAAYKPSGVEAVLRQPATVVLQFPIVATTLLRRDGGSWTDLKANPVSVSLQIFSTTTKLGTFVAAGPPLNLTSPNKKSFPTAIVISAGAALAAVVAGLFARMRAKKRRGRGSTAATRRPPGSGGKSPKR